MREAAGPGSGRRDRAAAGDGSDEHYAALAAVATVNQLHRRQSSNHGPTRPQPEPQRSISKTSRTTSPTGGSNFRTSGGEIRRRAGVPSGCADRRMEERSRQPRRRVGAGAPVPGHRRRLPAPGRDLVGCRVARRPRAQHSTVVVHVDVEQRAAALHLGPLLAGSDRRYLTCDATCEAWFERDGAPIGAGRATRSDQPSASPRPRAPRPRVRGSRLRSHPRSPCSPHQALGRRRPHRTGQPRAGMPLPSPAASSRRHHHHR